MGEKGIVKKVTDYSHFLFLFAFILFYALMILEKAYLGEGYISQDSANYLREAAVIRAGYGFNVNALAGGQRYFSAWPIGYPACIAAVSFLFNIEDLYLASKILSIFAVILTCGVLAGCYRKKCAVIVWGLFNAGILEINYFTWSETLFIPLLLINALWLYRLWKAEEVRWQEYLLLFFLMLGAFLIRFYGAVTFAFAGLMWIALLISGIKTRNAKVRRKLIALGVTGISCALAMGSYLLFNRKLSGYATGVERGFSEDRLALTKNLISALAAELKNMFFLDRVFPGADLGWCGAVVFLLGLGLIVFCRYHKYKQLKADDFLILFALFYDLVFIVLRYRTTMDPFGSRFFAPASLIAMIGIAGMVLEHIPERFLKIVVVAAAVVCIIGGGVLLHRISRPGMGYRQAKTYYTQRYSSIPPRSVCLYAEEIPDYFILYFRPDVDAFAKSDSVYAGYGVDPSWTINDIIHAYGRYDYVCVRKDAINKYIINDETFNTELKEAFLRYVKLDEESEYVVIPTSSAEDL